MKIHCTITDEEYQRIEPYIECSEWANPMEDEFIFYNPSPRFMIMLALYDIEIFKEE